MLLGVALITALIPSLPAVAQESVRFKILDERGRPIPFASISVLGRTGSVASDENGEFTLRPLPAAPFEIAAAAESGVWLGIARIESISDGLNEVRLSRPEEQLTVLSGIAPSTPTPPASATAVVSRQEIDERRPARVADLIQDIPGVGRVDEGHSVVPSIRGMARSRTLLLVDDARVTAERRAGPSAGFLDPFSVENVDVVRGPGSVAYGSDAFGGVIHMKTPLPATDGFAGRYTVAGAAGMNGGSAGLQLNIPAASQAFLVQARLRSFDDYDGPRGTVASSGTRDRGLLLRGLHPIDSGRLIWGMQIDQVRDMGKPSADSDVVRSYYPKEDSLRLTAGADLAEIAGFETIEVRGFIGASSIETARDLYPSAASNGRLALSSLSARDASFRVVGGRSISDGRLRLGIDLSSRFGLSAENDFAEYSSAGQVLSRSSELAIGSARRVDTGLFVEIDHPLASSRALLAGGFRVDRVASRTSGGYFGARGASNTAPSGYASLTMTLSPRLAATLQYSRGFREPLLSDRYFRGVSGRGFIIGNPDLLAERSNQLDIAVRSTLGRMNLAAFGYFYRISRLIERYRDGSDFAFRNRGTLELRGAEVELSGRIAGTLTLRAGMALEAGRITEDASDPDDVPPPSIFAVFDQVIGSKGWWRLRAAAYGRDERQGPTEAVRPGYAVIDVAAGYKLIKALELRLLISNLLDREYAGSADAAAAIAPGRSISVSIGGSF